MHSLRRVIPRFNAFVESYVKNCPNWWKNFTNHPVTKLCCYWGNHTLYSNDTVGTFKNKLFFPLSFFWYLNIRLVESEEIQRLLFPGLNVYNVKRISVTTPWSPKIANISYPYYHKISLEPSKSINFIQIFKF